jgi:hypothetical protein
MRRNRGSARPSLHETRHRRRTRANRVQAADARANTTPHQPDTEIAETKHGGLIGGHDHAYSSGRSYDFDGLARVAGDGGRWPHLLIMGEGDRYELAGGEGMWEAAAAMRAAGGRLYDPLACELPREGLYAQRTGMRIATQPAFRPETRASGPPGLDAWMRTAWAPR